MHSTDETLREFLKNWKKVQLYVNLQICHLMCWTLLFWPLLEKTKGYILDHYFFFSINPKLSLGTCDVLSNISFQRSEFLIRVRKKTDMTKKSKKIVPGSERINDNNFRLFFFNILRDEIMCHKNFRAPAFSWGT